MRQNEWLFAIKLRRRKLYNSKEDTLKFQWEVDEIELEDSSKTCSLSRHLFLPLRTFSLSLSFTLSFHLDSVCMQAYAGSHSHLQTRSHTHTFFLSYAHAHVCIFWIPASYNAPFLRQKTQNLSSGFYPHTETQSNTELSLSLSLSHYPLSLHISYFRVPIELSQDDYLIPPVPPWYKSRIAH